MADPPPTYHRSRRREGIDFTTLIITAVASGAAAYTCSKLWAPGTLPSAAATPVLVAIIREGLQRPTEVVTRAVPVRGVVRSADPHGDNASEPEPDPAPPTRVAQSGAIGEPPRRWNARWRLAVVTGLLGFLVCAVAFTVPELVAGGSAGGGNRGTTLFGGHTHKKKDASQQHEQTPTTTSPTKTVTTPGRTVTAPPVTKTTPTTATPPPTQTAPSTATTTVQTGQP